MWVQSLVTIFAIIVNVQLVIFHAWIARLGLSTYDYIGYKKKLKEKKAEVVAGTLTEAEFNEWKQKALIFPEKPKSSIVTRLK